MTTRHAVIGLLTLVMASGSAWAQPPEPRDPPPPPREGQPDRDRGAGPDRDRERGPRRPLMDRRPGPPGEGPGPDRPWLDQPEAMRGVLTVFRDRLQKGLDRVNDGIAALDRGEDPVNVRRSLEQAGRELRLAWGNLGMGGPGGPGMGQRMGGPEGGPRPGEGPGGPGPGGEGPRRGPMTPEERDRLRAMLREHRPALVEKLDRLGKNDAKAVDRLLGAIAGRVSGLAESRDHDPDMFKLRGDELDNLVSVMDAASRLALSRRSGAPEAEAQKVRAELRGYMEQQFDIRVRIQERQLQDLKRRAERMQADIDSLKGDRDKFVQSKLDEVVKRAERGESNPPPQPPPN